MALSAGKASAGVSSYCGNQTLGAWGWCSGSPRTLYRVYGWGDQHSVCVSISGAPGTGWGYTCSSGPGVGVYGPSYEPAYLYPDISNNSAGTNTVHGVAYQP